MLLTVVLQVLYKNVMWQLAYQTCELVEDRITKGYLHEPVHLTKAR